MLGCIQVKVETIVERGDARDVICQVAERLHVDMLVMGSHGYGVIKRYAFYYYLYFNLNCTLYLLVR